MFLPTTQQELKELGIHISVDDFGMGYSSLSYLKQFSIDRLKIDRSFVSGADSDTRDAALATAIIGMAHALSINIIPEGVENTNQLNYLEDLDCQVMQGFLFNRPMPVADFLKNVVNQHEKLSSLANA